MRSGAAEGTKLPFGRGAGGRGPSLPSLPRLNLSPAVTRVLLIGVGAVALVGALTLLLAKVGGEPRTAATATTVDPAAPPPIGQLPLGARTTTTLPTEVAPGWVTYRSPDGTFAVAFPGQPTPRGYQRTFGPLTQNGLEVHLQVGTDGPQYSAVTLDLVSASAFADSQDFYEQHLADLYDLTGTFEPVPGVSAVSVVRKPGTGLGTNRGFVFVKGKRVYLVESLDASDEDHHLFVTSFRWLNDPVI